MMKRTTLSLLFLLSFVQLLFSQDLVLHYSAQKVSKPVRQLVKKIADQNRVHGSLVGFSPYKTAQYARFELLLERATVEELVELCEHPVSCVRAYAFWGLAKKQYAQLEDIFMAHAADTETVGHTEGCKSEVIPLIDWMTEVVQQRFDPESKKLDDAALARMHTRREILMKSKNDPDRH